VRPMERLAATRPLHRRLPPDTFGSRSSLLKRPVASAVEVCWRAGAGARDGPEVMLGRGTPGDGARGRVESTGAGVRRLGGRERRHRVASAPTGQRCPCESLSPGYR
jgi:hypothetical protein